MKKILMIALMIGLVLMTVPVMAGTPNEDGTCIVPNDEYFITDSPATNGMAVHEGIQNGFVFLIPNTASYPISPFAGGHYLGLTHHTYKLKQSHNEQEKIAMGRLYYCDSLPTVPYEAPVTQFTSEDPDVSTYFTTQEIRAGMA